MDGYYDEYGSIRDILRNHILQVMALMAMDHYQPLDWGEEAFDMPPPIFPEDCVLGQYQGYQLDPTVSNKESCTPMFAAVRLFVDNARCGLFDYVYRMS